MPTVNTVLGPVDVNDLGFTLMHEHIRESSAGVPFTFPELVEREGAIARGVGDTGDVIDPIVTGVAVVRVPFGRSNYGAVLTASTNGQIALGVSLMNISPLPVLP